MRLINGLREVGGLEVGVNFTSHFLWRCVGSRFIIQLVSSLKQCCHPVISACFGFQHLVSSTISAYFIYFLFSSLSLSDCLLSSVLSLSFIRSYIDLRPVMLPPFRSRLHPNLASDFILHCLMSQKALSFYADKENM
jgi:hypothetical protein